MSTLSPDEARVLHEEWLDHEHTRIKGKAMDEDVKQAVLGLRTACFKTTDPSVAAAMATLAAVEKAREYFTGRKHGD